MATIKYNGMELEEQIYSEPTIINDSREAIVWNDYANKDRALVYSYDPRSDYPVRSNNDNIWKHFAFIPEKPAPRRATNRELAKWLAQGYGEWKYEHEPDSKLDSNFASINYHYEDSSACNFVSTKTKVRKWDDTEWHTPDVEYMGITEEKTYEDVVKREG